MGHQAQHTHPEKTKLSIHKALDGLALAPDARGAPPEVAALLAAVLPGKAPQEPRPTSGKGDNSRPEADSPGGAGNAAAAAAGAGAGAGSNGQAQQHSRSTTPVSPRHLGSKRGWEGGAAEAGLGILEAGGLPPLQQGAAQSQQQNQQQQQRGHSLEQLPPAGNQGATLQSLSEGSTAKKGEARVPLPDGLMDYIEGQCKGSLTRAAQSPGNTRSCHQPETTFP